MNLDLESLVDCYEYNHLVDMYDTLILEFKQGMIAYQNALVLKDVASQYGDTEALISLIGNEGLLDTAKEAITRFVTWLRNMMKKFLSWLLRIADTIRRRLSKMLGFSNINAEIEWDVNILELEKFITAEVEHTAINISRDDTPDDIKDYYQQKISKLTGIINASSNKHTAYTLARLHKHANQISTCINNTVDDIETGSACIEKLMSKLKAFEGHTLTDQELASLQNTVRDTLQHLVDSFCPKLINKIELNTFSIDNTKKLLLVILEVIHQRVRINSILLSYLQELQKVCTKAKAQIHMEFPFDQDFLKRVGDFFGGKLFATKLIISNLPPDTWNDPINGKMSGVGGWMIGGAYPVTLVLNANYLLSIWQRWMYVGLGGKSSFYTSKEDWFISTIVHECKHLFDYQNDGPRDDNNKVPYPHRAHESSARNAVNKYVITNADRAWAKKIIQAVEAEYKKQANK